VEKSIENDTRQNQLQAITLPWFRATARHIHISYSYHRNDIKPGRSVMFPSPEWIKIE
jgi:hypothetical protein